MGFKVSFKAKLLSLPTNVRIGWGGFVTLSHFHSSLKFASKAANFWSLTGRFKTSPQILN